MFDRLAEGVQPFMEMMFLLYLRAGPLCRPEGVFRQKFKDVDYSISRR